MITGKIEQITAQPYAPGSQVQIFITYRAYKEGSLVFDWGTKLIAKADGLGDVDTDMHYGCDGDRMDKPSVLKLGIMPDHSLSGFVTLESQGRVLDTQAFTVEVAREALAVVRHDPYLVPVVTTSVMPSPTTPTFEIPFETKTPEQKKQTWLWVGLAVVGVVAIGLLVK